MAMTIKDNCGKSIEIPVAKIPELLQNTKKEILSASHYGAELRHGNACDSSDYNGFRMEYVQRAEEAFLRKHAKEILRDAAALVDEDIRALSLTT